MTTIRRHTDETGGYMTTEGVRFSGLAAVHRIDHEMRVAGYKPVGDWQDGSRLFILQTGETEKEVTV